MARLLVSCWMLSVVAVVSAETPKFSTLDEYASFLSIELKKLSEAERLYVGARQEGGGPTLNSEEMRQGTWGTRKDPLRVTQVLAADRALIKYGDFEWLIVGIDTSGWADGGLYPTGDHILFVHGNETLTTVLGAARTVNSIHVVDRPEVTAVLVGAEFLRRAKKFEGVGEAAFLELKGGLVTFARADQSGTKIKLTELTAGDQKWIRDFLAKEAAQEREREKTRRAAALKRKR